MLMPAAPVCLAATPLRMRSVADLRARALPRLDEAGATYLDYAGAALYPASAVDLPTEPADIDRLRLLVRTASRA